MKKDSLFSLLEQITYTKVLQHVLPTHFIEHPFSYLPAKYCPNLNKPQTIYLIASLRANPAPV